MGANYRISTGRAPREDYAPRKLISSTDTVYRGSSRRKSPSPQNDNVEDESLPRGWSILEPNRIKERRLAAGYKTTDALSLKINSISYLRLHKIECGIVVVRESEYELIADALGLTVDQLKLPMLMKSETVQWMDLWGADRTIEEGGSHNDVLLAAYVRYHAHKFEMGPTQVAKHVGVPQNAMHFIWHAAKPIDRYPDTTMHATMKLTGHDSWDEVITASQDHYQAGHLEDFVKDVQKPRVRYAPEDPSKMAPWTYDTNPFRPHVARRRYANAYSATRKRTRKPDFAQLTQLREENLVRVRFFQEMKSIVHTARTMDDPVGTLADMFPDYADIITESASQDYARATYARVRTIGYLIDNPNASVIPVSQIFDLTRERIRQLRKQALERGLVSILPLNSSAHLVLNDPQWITFRDAHVVRSKRSKA